MGMYQVHWIRLLFEDLQDVCSLASIYNCSPDLSAGSRLAYLTAFQNPCWHVSSTQEVKVSNWVLSHSSP